MLQTIYCAYGYSINKPTAQYLLKQTSKISTPFDIFKQFLEPQKIKIGTIKKEVITTSDIGNQGSYIRKTKTKDNFKRAFYLLILNIKNSIQAYFS